MTSAHSQMQDMIQVQQVKNLFAETPSTIAAHLMTAAAVLVYLWPPEPMVSDLPIFWMLAMAIACTIRLGLYLRFQHTRDLSLRWRAWAHIGSLISAGFGLLWGAAIIMFFDMLDYGAAILLTVIPIGLTAAAAGRNASIPVAFALFDIPITISLALVLFTSESRVGIIVGILVLFTSVQRFTSSRHLHGVLDHSLRLGFENLALRKEAERANAAKTRFLAAASHDLRQPIHALGLSFSALAPRLSTPDVAPIVSHVENCIEAIRQMLGALLDISKLDAGVVQPRPQNTDLWEMLARLERELAPIAEKTGNQLRVQLQGVPSLYTDPGMLESILRNLLGNALRYTHNGRVLVAARSRGEYVRIEVHDTGIGIPQDQLDDIFVEFRQLDNPAHERGRGLGLGLAIVKRLAALLDLPIEVRSQPGRGSCFCITVPVATRPSIDKTGDASGAVPYCVQRSDTGTVLVLDDDPAVRGATATLLSTWGYRVLVAGAIDEALELAMREPFQLLVCDYRLPNDTTGAEAIDALQRQRGVAIPSLLITGDTAPDRLREAGTLGVPLLHKPVQPAKLRAALQQLSSRATP